MPDTHGTSSASTSHSARGIDYEISRREAAFAPAELDGMLSNATYSGRKLTLGPTAIIDTPADNALEAPTPWYLSPIFVCWLFFGITLAITVRDIRRRRVSRWFDCAYFAVLGLAGCLLTFLIFISVHEATSPNYLFAWLNPFCLIPAIFIWKKIARPHFLLPNC